MTTTFFWTTLYIPQQPQDFGLSWTQFFRYDNSKIKFYFDSFHLQVSMSVLLLLFLLLPERFLAASAETDVYKTYHNCLQLNWLGSAETDVYKTYHYCLELNWLGSACTQKRSLYFICCINSRSQLRTHARKCSLEKNISLLDDFKTIAFFCCQIYPDWTIGVKWCQM